MNTNQLKKFAQEARRKLIDQVASRLNYVLNTDSGYFNWLLNADFPLYTKNTLKSIKLKLLNNKLS